MRDGYHHGNLRAAILKRAVEVIDAQGISGLSLRALATDAGVSHTAPRHHFGDLRGVLTAIAAEGYGLLADRLTQSRRAGESFLDVGVAYVEFALDNRAHFGVMFSPRLLDDDNAELEEARQRAFFSLRSGVEALAANGQVEDAAAAIVAGWGLMHGIATLALTGNLDKAELRQLIAGGDVLAIARRAGGMLYGSHYPPEAPPGEESS